MLKREEELIGIIKEGEKLKTVDIVERSRMSKVTVLKYLQSLRGSGRVDYERAGPTKLWFCNGGAKEPEEILQGAQKLLRRYEGLTGKRVIVILLDGGPEDIKTAPLETLLRD